MHVQRFILWAPCCARFGSAPLRSPRVAHTWPFRHGRERRPPPAEGYGIYCNQRHRRYATAPKPPKDHPTCTARSSQPVRLHRSLKGADAATLKRIASAESGNSKQSFATGAAPGQQPRSQAARDQRGAGGNVPFCIPPGGFPPRGSMTLRRAKAASHARARVV